MIIQLNVPAAERYRQYLAYYNKQEPTAIHRTEAYFCAVQNSNPYWV